MRACVRVRRQIEITLIVKTDWQPVSGPLARVCVCERSHACAFSCADDGSGPLLPIIITVIIRAINIKVCISLFAVVVPLRLFVPAPATLHTARVNEAHSAVLIVLYVARAGTLAHTLRLSPT